MQRSAVIALSLVTALSACSSPSAEDDHGYGDGLGDPDNPVPQAADKGPYATRTMVDFTVEAILPPQAELVVVTLRAFADNPARTLVTVADKAGVPAVKQLYDAIPGFIKDRIEGWINGEIAKFKINGKTVQQYAGEVAALAETALTQFALDSTLAISPTQTTHTLTALDLEPAGIPVRIPIGGFAADLLTQHPTISVAEGGAFSLGDQHFGLAYGEYAWQGINAGVATVFGGDIRTSLGKVVPCGTIASAIADKCVFSVCVGHESLINSICEGGLDAIVNEVHGRFSDLKIDVFRFISGQARLVDDDQDGVADRIVDGAWDSEMNLGLGLRRAPATFSATR